MRAKLSLLLALAWPHVALADDQAAQCAASYEAGQVARAESQLLKAREALSVCTRSECADFIRADCARWLAEVEAALPSVVFAASDGGRDVQDVSVSVDGAALVAKLDGKAVSVEPGRHTFVFRRAGHADMALEVVISEGERNRKLLAEFKPVTPATQAKEPPAAAPSSSGSSRVVPAVLLGVAALGAASFTTFGALGLREKQDREGACAPRCDDESVESIQRKFLIADVSLGVAVVALAGSAYFFFAASPKAPERASAFNADVRVSARGATGAVRWSF